MSRLPLVSIIVPVHNEEEMIAISLNTLIRQSYQAKEVIIVDDGSTDRTPEILSKMAKGNSMLQVISIGHSGLTVARNTGFRSANGDIVFFGEGDALYKSDYVAKAVELMMKDPKVGGVCLTGAPWIVKSNFVTQSIDVENRIQRRLLVERKLAVFYAWVYWRRVVDAVGGFDEQLFQAEDKDFFLRVRKAGYSIGLINGVYWRHRRDQDLTTFTKRCYRGGKTRILYLIKYRMIVQFLRTVGFLWFVIMATVFGIVFPILYLLVLLALGSLLIYKLTFAIRFGWKVVEKKRYLFSLPLFTLIRHVSTALGTTYGLISFSIRRLSGKSVDWSSL